MKTFVGISTGEGCEERREACRKTWLPLLDKEKFECFFVEGGYEGPEDYKINGDMISFKTPKTRHVEVWAYTENEEDQGSPIRAQGFETPEDKTLGIRTWDGRYILTDKIYRKSYYANALAAQWLYLTPIFRAACKFALEVKNLNRFMKLDDDDYVVPRNMNAYDFEDKDLVGYFDRSSYPELNWCFGSCYSLSKKAMQVLVDKGTEENYSKINSRGIHMDDVGMGTLLKYYIGNKNFKHEEQMKPWKPEYDEPLLPISEHKKLIVSHGYTTVSQMENMHMRMTRIYNDGNE